MRHLKTVAVLGLALTLAGCGKKADPTLLARVGTNEIRLPQFQQQMQRRSGLKPETLDKAALLDEMVNNEALYVKALRLGLDKDPDIQRACRNLLLQKLKERELTPQLEHAAVTSQELQAAYDKDLQRYQRPRQIHLAALFLRANPVLNTNQLAELKNRLAQARSSALEPVFANERGFGSLAINCSEDQASRYKGGDIGWVDDQRAPSWLPPEILAQAWALDKPGAISGVLTSSQGVYVLKLMERRDADFIPLKDVEPALRQKLLTEKQQQIERAFVQQIRQSLPIELYAESLAAIPPIATQNKTSDHPPRMP
jgi:peptidyl-prolyl cis-trans isomerase C